jgi:hypothetical protein
MRRAGASHSPKTPSAVAEQLATQRPANTMPLTAARSRLTGSYGPYDNALMRLLSQTLPSASRPKACRCAQLHGRLG